MKSENGIKNRWELLSEVLGNPNVKRDFSAYGWYQDGRIKMSKNEHWSGWWNDCFDFVDMWATSAKGKQLLQKAVEVFAENGYTIKTGLINGGISISYETMTAQESHEKAKRNLLNGGRMSD